MITAHKQEAQGVLDELFADHLLPFELSARKVTKVGVNEYVIHFHDSRMRSVTILWSEDKAFTSIFRTSVLERVKRLSGPLSLKSVEPKPLAKKANN